VRSLVRNRTRIPVCTSPLFTAPLSPFVLLLPPLPLRRLPPFSRADLTAPVKTELAEFVTCRRPFGPLHLLSLSLSLSLCLRPYPSSTPRAPVSHLFRSDNRTGKARGSAAEDKRTFSASSASCKNRLRARVHVSRYCRLVGKNCRAEKCSDNDGIGTVSSYERGREIQIPLLPRESTDG